MAAMRKKAMFLTFIAIALMAAFIVLLSPKTSELDEKVQVGTRISLTNDFLVDLEEVYFPRSLETSGTRAIKALILYMQSQNRFVGSFEPVFIEVMQNGTLSGISIDSLIGPNLMLNQTFSDWVDKMASLSEDTFHAQLGVEVKAISAYQLDPWNVIVEANLSYSLVLPEASWRKEKTIIAQIPIDRFDDPYLSINTQNAIVQRINRTTLSNTAWNDSNVQNHIYYGTYTHFESGLSPSFINRFSNKTSSSSCCGIESIVDPNDLANGNRMESYADYLFFSHNITDCNGLYNITYPSYYGLKLDPDHVSGYQISSAYYERTC